MRSQIRSGGAGIPRTTLSDGREGGLIAGEVTVLNANPTGKAIIEHIPAATPFSGAAPTITASGWIARESFSSVLIDLSTDATGGNLNVIYSNDGGVTQSNTTTTKAIASTVGATITSKEVIVPAAGSAATELLLKDYPFFKVTLDSGTGTSTTCSCFVTMER